MQKRFQTAAILCLFTAGCSSEPASDQLFDVDDDVSAVDAAVGPGWTTVPPFYWPYCSPYVTFAYGSDGGAMKAAVCVGGENTHYSAFVTIMNQSRSAITSEVPLLHTVGARTVEARCLPRKVNGYQTVWCVGGSIKGAYKSVGVTSRVTIRGKSSITKNLTYTASIGSP